MLCGYALVGPMLSGKTTAAEVMVAYGLRKVALADALKDDCLVLLNTWLAWHESDIELDRLDLDEAKDVFRPFLQWFGTDFVRRYCGVDSYWVDRFLEIASEVDEPVVCDDCRFPNEAETLRGYGIKIVRIERPEEQRLAAVAQKLRDRGLDDEEIAEVIAMQSAHASETMHAAIEADYTLVNDGDVDAFRAEVARFVTGESRGKAA